MARAIAVAGWRSGLGLRRPSLPTLLMWALTGLVGFLVLFPLLMLQLLFAFLCTALSAVFELFLIHLTLVR